jgi:hypothetical protein
MQCNNSRITSDNVQNVFHKLSFVGLTIINLSNNRIGDAGCKAIAAVIPLQNMLQEIQLANNKIGDRGASAIAEALRGNGTITKVGLAFNQITNAGVQAWRSILNECLVLTALSLVGNSKITEQRAFAIEQILQLPIFLRESEAASTAAASGLNPYSAHRKELAAGYYGGTDNFLGSQSAPTCSYSFPIGPPTCLEFIREKEEAIKQAEQELEAAHASWVAAVTHAQENPGLKTPIEAQVEKGKKKKKKEKKKKRKGKGKGRSSAQGEIEEEDADDVDDDVLRLIHLEQARDGKEKKLKDLQRAMRVSDLMLRRHQRKIGTRRQMVAACSMRRTSPKHTKSALQRALPAISLPGGGDGSVFKINLSHQILGARDLPELVAALRTNHHLLRLNLSGNDIADAGVMAIADALRTNEMPVLQELLLRNNNIGDPGAASLLSLVHFASSFVKPTHSHYHPDSGSHQQQPYQKLQSLTKIDLQENYSIRKDRTIAIERALVKNRQDVYSLPMRLLVEARNRRARAYRFKYRFYEREARVCVQRQEGDLEMEGTDVEGEDEDALHTISLVHSRLGDGDISAGIAGEQYRDALITGRQLERNLRGLDAVVMDDAKIAMGLAADGGEDVTGSGEGRDPLMCADWAVQVPPTKHRLFDAILHRYSHTHQLLRDECEWNGDDSVLETEMSDSLDDSAAYAIRNIVPHLEVQISTMLLQHNELCDGAACEVAQALVLHASWLPPPLRLRHFNSDMGRMMHREALPGVYGSLHSSLLRLHLAHNEIGGEGVIALAEALSGSWRYRRPLSPRAARQNDRREQGVDHQYRGVSPALAAGASIGLAVPSSSGTLYLDLPGDGGYGIVPPGGAQPFVGGFSSQRAQELVLNEACEENEACEDGNADCGRSSRPCRPLPQVPALKFLFLSHNNICNEGAKRLAAMLRVNSRLQLLDIAENGRVDPAVTGLITQLMKMSFLERNGHEQWAEIRRRRALEARFGDMLGESRRQAEHLDQVIRTQVDNGAQQQADVRDLKERLAKKRAARRREWAGGR